MASSPAVIMERVREIHRSFQEQIDQKRARLADPSTTTLGAGLTPPAGPHTAQPALDEAGPSVTTNQYQRFYAPNSFVGQWLDKHPDTTLKDISIGTSSAPLRTFLGPPAVPMPAAEPAGFTGLVHTQTPQAPSTAQAHRGGEEGGDEGEDGDVADLVAMGSANEVSQWLKAVRELQAEGRTAASDWSAAEQQQVEVMVREELQKAQAAAKVEDDRGYQRMLTLQTIAEHLAAISRRPSFDEMPASDGTIDDWLEALREKVEDWYLNKRDASSTDGGAKAEVKAASRKQKINQISSGLASAAAHEGLLLTAQQLDQVLKAFYAQDQQRPANTNGNGDGGAPTPFQQRAVARLSRQLAETAAREDAVRRVMAARNKALVAEIGRLNQMLEAATGYGGGVGGGANTGAGGTMNANASTTSNGSLAPSRGAHRPSMAGGPRGVSFSGPASSSNEDGVMNLVQMMADHNASKQTTGEDYGLAHILRNRGAVESLNSITFVVAEALSRRRMRTLQGQVDKLRAALTSMKTAYTTAHERLHGLTAENTRLTAELADFTTTFASWKEIKAQQDAERRRLAKEGGSELTMQKEVMNLLMQRTTALLGQVTRTLGETGAVATKASHQLNLLTPRSVVGANARRPSMATSPQRGLLDIMNSPSSVSGGGRRRSNTMLQQQCTPTALRRVSATPSVGGGADIHSGASSRRSSIGRDGEGSNSHLPTPAGSQHPSGAGIAAGAEASAQVAQTSAAVRHSMRLVGEWVQFATSALPSDSSRMLLGDLAHQVALHEQQWAAEDPLQQHGATADGAAAVAAADRKEEDSLVESLSHRLDQAICEVKDKLREERFMRTTVAYFVKSVEEMCAGTFKEDPANGEGEEEEQRLAQLREGVGTTLTGVKNPLDKLKPMANIRVKKAFPPKAVTVPDTEYGYAWPEETSSLQRLFAQLKTVLTRQVERTETTNAMIGALERYHSDGPAYKGSALPPIQSGAGRAALLMSSASPTASSPGGARRASDEEGAKFSPYADSSRRAIPSPAAALDRAKALGDPNGILTQIQAVNSTAINQHSLSMLRGGGPRALAPLAPTAASPQSKPQLRKK